MLLGRDVYLSRVSQTHLICFIKIQKQETEVAKNTAEHTWEAPTILFLHTYNIFKKTLKIQTKKNKKRIRITPRKLLT